tara:strand:- start:260 stop:502 length:243 start_codon:yes stop_codon:yes gene_type:complete
MKQTSMYDEMTGDDLAYKIHKLKDTSGGMYTSTIYEKNTKLTVTTGIHRTPQEAKEWVEKCVIHIALGLDEPPDAYDNRS